MTTTPAPATMSADPATAITVVPGLPGAQTTPGAFTILIGDRHGQKLELGGPRAELLQVLDTAQAMLAAYCQAEHANGYHLGSEPGCPDCAAEAAEEPVTDTASAKHQDAVAGVVHTLARSGGYAAVHTPGTGVVDIYDDASAWDHGETCLASVGLAAAGASAPAALGATLTAWLDRNPERAAAANGPMSPTAHYVVRHADFVVIGTPARGVIEIYPDMTAWNGGANPRHTETVQADRPFTAQTVAAITQQWWLEKAED